MSVLDEKPTQGQQVPLMRSASMKLSKPKAPQSEDPPSLRDLKTLADIESYLNQRSDGSRYPFHPPELSNCKRKVLDLKCGCVLTQHTSPSFSWIRIQSPSGEVYEGTPPRHPNNGMWGRLINRYGCWYEGKVSNYKAPTEHRADDEHHQACNPDSQYGMLKRTYDGEHKDCGFFFGQRHSPAEKAIQQCRTLCIYQGPWVNDLKDTSKSTIEGVLEVYDSKLRVYTGEWHQGKKHGKGIDDKKGSLVYEGEFDHGYWRKGKVSYWNRTVFTGEFRAPKPGEDLPDSDLGFKEGPGYFDRSQLLGQSIKAVYKDNLPTGPCEATSYAANGDIFTGYYAQYESDKHHEGKKACKEGKGKMLYHNGFYCEGTWVKNVLISKQAKITFLATKPYEGACLLIVRFGEGRQMMWNGYLVEGTFTPPELNEIEIEGWGLNRLATRFVTALRTPTKVLQKTPTFTVKYIQGTDANQVIHYLDDQGSHWATYIGEGDLLDDGDSAEFLRQGQGKFEVLNGEYTYEGKWKSDFEDDEDGQASYMYPDPEDGSKMLYYKYKGGFEEGYRSGKGRLWNERIPNHWYDGEFQLDVPHGQGEFQYPNGHKYFGEFYQGLYHGLGVYRHANKKVNSGRYLFGNVYGVANSFFPGNKKFEGVHEDDKRQGYGRFTNGKGKLISGFWKERLLEGTALEMIPKHYETKHVAASEDQNPDDSFVSRDDRFDEVHQEEEEIEFRTVKYHLNHQNKAVVVDSQHINNANLLQYHKSYTPDSWTKPALQTGKKVKTRQEEIEDLKRGLNPDSQEQSVQMQDAVSEGTQNYLISNSSPDSEAQSMAGNSIATRPQSSLNPTVEDQSV